MNKFKIRTSKLTVLAIGVLLAFTLSLVFTVSNRVSAFAAEANTPTATAVAETKIYSKATINEDFDDSSVLVVLDKRTSGINKQHEDSFFGDFAKTAIYDLTYINSADKNRSSIDETEFNQTLKIELPVKSKANVLDVIRQLEKIEGVLIAEPNYTFEPAAQPTNSSGTRYSNLWAMHGAFGIQAEDTWNITTGVRNSVRVGVIDSEMEIHADLTGNRVNEGGDFFNMTNVNQNIPGSLRTNIDGHGTHVAGTIGATGTNANGVAGVAWNVQLIPLQISFWDTSVTPNRWRWGGDALVRAIRWCTANNIDIINLSGGGFGDSATIRNAINDFEGLFVAAAGNGNDAGVGQNNDTTRYYPSDYSRGQTFSGRFMSVGAINNTGNITGFSNFGAASVSIFAPGNSIWSCVPNTRNATGYASLNGTSMATPHVTGTAALMWTVYANSTNTLTRAQRAAAIKTSIINNAVTDDAGTPLNGRCVANGRLNAFRAVSSVAFRTSNVNGGISIDGLATGFTLANNANLVLPDRFAPSGGTTQSNVVAIANSAFSYCTQLSQITIPASVKEIGKNAFFNTALWNNAPNNRIVYVDNWAVGYKGTLNELNLENEIIGIADYAFENLDIDRLVIPDSVTAIGFGAFKNCRNISSITIPFLGCVLENNSTKNSHLGYIFGAESSFDQTTYIPKMLTDITITKAKYLKDYAFKGCNQIRNIFLPETVSHIGTSVFDDCINLEEITMDENNQDYFCQDGILYARLKLKSLIWSVPKAIKGNVVLPNDVEYINGSFTNRYTLESIVILNSVSWIAFGSFQGCNNLYSITLPFVGDNHYYNIYNVNKYFGYIFGAPNSTNQTNYVPISLKEVIITGVEQKDSYVFKRVDSIDNYAFTGCDSITSVFIPSSIKSIGVGAFENCLSLQTVIFDGATLLHENSFKNPTRFIVTSCELKKYYEQYLNTFCNILDCSCGFLMNVDSISLLEIQGTILHGSISVNDKIRLATTDSLRLSAIVSAEVLHVNNQEVNSAMVGENIKISFNFNKSLFKKTYASRCDNLHNNITEFKITDYDYQGQYYFDELTSHYDLIDLTINTKRLRAGYIEKEYIVLSPRRANAGVAYLEYNFSKPIRFITVDIALWSAKENLNRSDCTAIFQYKDKNGNWITKLDFLNDVELTTDRSSPNTYTILFDEPVTDYRFYLISPAVGSSNSGRICIGNMFINYL